MARPSELVEAVPLTNDSIALSWQPAPNPSPYRLYSDMGSGFGVYVFKAQTADSTFIDHTLRPGNTYNYRITQLDGQTEAGFSQAAAATFGSVIPVIDLLGSLASPAQRVAPATQLPALPANTVLLGQLSDNSFTDNFNTLTIVGEIKNDSPAAVGHTNILATFYDAGGAVIETAAGPSLLKTVGAGEISPFLITLSRPAGMVSYSLRATARPAEPAAAAQISVSETKRYEDTTGFLHIKGAITNVGNSAARRVKVAAVLYGRDGRVINVGFAYASPPSLAPGHQAAYDITFAHYPRFFSQKVIPFEE
jgi:hypothetical protein